MQGAGQSKKLVGWTGGSERAMVVQHGYTWAGVPGTDVCGACAGKSACRGALEAPDG